MASTTFILLAAWLGLNAAYLGMRLYVTADRARTMSGTKLAGLRVSVSPLAGAAGN